MKLQRGEIEWLVVGILLFAIVGIVLAVWTIHEGSKEEEKKRQEFMVDCLKERKQYECTSMWRSGEKHEEVVPIFIPMR